MKKVSDIIGLSIISIDKGISVGKVKNVIINAKKGTVDFIILENDNQNMVTRIIAAIDVVGLGEYALTIQDEVVIHNIEEIPSALDLLHRGIKITNTKVLTKKGRLIGEIGGVFIDDSEGEMRISGLEFIQDIAKKAVKIIPRVGILTFGKELIVVEENVEELLLENASQLDTTGYKNEIKIVSSLPKIQTELRQRAVPKRAESMKIEENDKENLLDETINLDEINEFEEGLDVISINNLKNKMDLPNNDFYNNDLSGSKAKVTKNENVTGLFEEKQREYLLGRTVAKNITDRDGNVLISKGTQIDNEVIDIVKNSGKLVELVMNNKT